jgi:hypothetical protein
MVYSHGSKTGPLLLVEAGEIGCKSETLEKQSWGCHVLMRLAYIDLAWDDISNVQMFSRATGFRETNVCELANSSVNHFNVTPRVLVTSKTLTPRDLLFDSTSGLGGSTSRRPTALS